MQSQLLNSLLNFSPKLYKWITLCIFISFLIIGIIITPDFGISYDEPIQRTHRLVNSKKVASALNILNLMPDYIQSASNFDNYPDKTYGVASQSPLILLEFFEIFHPQNRVYWYATHYYTHLLFFLSAVCFYFILKKQNIAPIVIIFSILLYFLHPRIYAHSFYNIKDLLFLSLMTINLYLFQCFANKRTKTSLVILALTSAFLVNARVVGLFIPLITFLHFTFFQKSQIKNKLIYFLIFGLTFFTSFLMLFPALWFNLFENLKNIITLSTKYTVWNGTVIFNGNLIKGANLPISYIPIWIGITSPLGYLFLLVLSLISVPILLFKRKIKDSQSWLALYSLLIIGLTYAMIIGFNSTLYGDWRHLYYLHIPFTLLSTIFLNYLWKRKSKLIYVIFLLLCLSFINTGAWMIKNHPHYYVYFNQLVGNDWDDKWDRDIWRLSTKQSLEELIKNESSRSKPLLIYKDYATYINSWIIKGEFRKNIIFVDDLATAEYRILDYRNKIGDYPDEIPPHFIKYKTIDVDNKPISAIYIKNELVEN